MYLKTFKKILRRIMAPVLAGVLAAGLLAGCGSGKDSKIINGVNTEFNDEPNIVDDKYDTCYQVLIYSFCDSDGDGIGDINGLTSKLDYIEDLGFTAIWLLPFTKSTTYHKYDVVDYYTIDPEYGTMEDWDNFAAECKERGIDIYMDFVFNHTSSANEWFREAVAYINTLEDDEEPDYNECPYAEYYNFEKRDTSKSGWQKVSGTDNWYYECVFWGGMPDLNLDCAAVRREIEDIASFWIDKGVTGFRLDAALHYFETQNDKNIEVLKWFSDYVKSIDPDIYCVAEVWDSYETIKKYYESGIDSIFNYTLGSKDGTIVKCINKAGNGTSGNNLASRIVSMYNDFSAINPDYVDGVFIGNHDVGRNAGFLGKVEGKIKLAAAVQLFQTGCVYVYYGDELGMSGSGSDENKRAPMYWTDGDSDEMTKGPSGCAAGEHKFGALDTQKDEEYSLYNYYRKAIHIRNKYPEIGRGVPSVMEDVATQDGNLCALGKKYNDETIYIIYNNSEEPTEITVSKDTYSYDGVSDYLCVDENLPEIHGDKITIPGYGCVILK